MAEKYAAPLPDTSPGQEGPGSIFPIGTAPTVIRNNGFTILTDPNFTVALAVQFSYLALDGAFIPSGMGMLGDTIEKTFENPGRLNNPGMVAVDRLLLGMITEVLP